MRIRFANVSVLLALFVGALISAAVYHGLRGAGSHVFAGPIPTVFGMLKARPPADAANVATSGGVPMSSVGEVSSRLGTGAPLRAQDQPRIPLPPRGGRAPSQLIRTANIGIEVGDVGKALRSATLITDEQLGDVIGLNDETPTSPNDAHTATMAIRVPQYRFEQTLDALGRLGKVKAKSVSAQDVSDQIVDAQARLRNLRRTEADILNIMDRSGNIEQVLNVTQELGNVRDQIERLDAQIQGMRYQVAYSTINISLISPAIVSTPSGFGLLGDAWKNATVSLRDLTVNILSSLLWLVAFSPYILGAALLAALAFRRLRSHPSPM